MPRGGARANSGPEVGAIYDKTLVKRAMREAVYAFVNERLESILEAMYRKSQGVTVLEKKENGKDRIYDLPPDPAAAKLLLEHAMGKPLQAIEASGKDGAPLFLPAEIFNKHNLDGTDAPSSDAATDRGGSTSV